ncbi:MAG: peptidoglycan-binding domain-containing protein [Methanobacterium sp.]
MPLASAADTPNLVNTLNKDKFVNAVSNNANTDKSTTLSKEEIVKLHKWAEEKKLDTNNNKELKLGSTGDQVKKLQTWLKENKFYAGNIDGNFGAVTEKSVKAFQKEAGLKEDGQVGDYTLLAMEQYDEYKATSTNTASASSGEKKVYSSAKTSASYNNAKKTYSKYKRYNGWGYINGMDCWAMSDYLAGQYGSKGYQTRIRHAKTSYSSDHRWVQIYQNGQWVNAPDYSGLPNIYNPTGS